MWKEYIEGLYEREELSDDVIEEETVIDIQELKDSILESAFKGALENMRSNKAEGIDNIPSLGEVATKRLFKLVCRIYDAGDVRSDFRKNIIYAIPKIARADK